MEFEVDRLDELKEKQELRGRTGFVIQYKYLEALTLLSDKERSEFLLAMYEYDLTGELPALSKRVRAVIKTLKYDIDKTRDVWERNNRNGRANKPKDDVPTENLSDKEENAEPRERSEVSANAEKEPPNKAKSGGFCPPTAVEAAEYARANGLSVNARDFVDYYESNGWMVGKNKMSNWRAALSRWARNEKSDREAKPSGKTVKPGFLQRQFDEKEEQKRRIQIMLEEGAKIEAQSRSGGG